MKQYLEMLDHVLNYGTRRDDRTGTGTLSVFGYQMRFDLARGFPVVTTKRVHLKSVIVELLWFLRGDTNIQFLHDYGVTIWDEWADAQGDWRSWPNPDGTHTDQIVNVIQQIKAKPYSRRHMVVAYNPSYVDQMALPPCHAMFQFYVADGKLSCQLYQRSADIFLGVPFNIASYALLTHMVAQQCNLDVGDFIWTGGDIHLYLNHIDQAQLQLSRTPFPLPNLKIHRKAASISDYKFDDFEIQHYQHHPAIKAPIAV